MDGYNEAIQQLLQPCMRVMSHYSCPEGCGECCKADITFDANDFKTMLKKCKDKKTEIRNSVEVDMDVYVKGKHITLYRFKNNDPCSMLIDKKCNIYEGRPLVCKVYPFTIGKAPTEDYIAIDSCPLGMQVMRDITAFLIHMAARTNQMTEEKKAKFVDEMIYKLYEVSAACLDFKPHTICKNMYVPLEWLIPFCDYLDSTNAIFMEGRRNFLRNALKQEYNISVTW